VEGGGIYNHVDNGLTGNQIKRTSRTTEKRWSGELGGGGGGEEPTSDGSRVPILVTECTGGGIAWGADGTRATWFVGFFGAGWFQISKNIPFLEPLHSTSFQTKHAQIGTESLDST
jgi:hypothetical protein